MENCTEITCCRLCDSTDLVGALDLGESPLANSFLSSTQVFEEQPKYPLKVYLCQNCGSVGLRHSVSPEVLFKNYFYESSTSASLRKHFEEYAKHVVEFCDLKPNDLIVEPASNDNILLRPYKDLGMNVVGVEPATNIVEKYKDDGITVINQFFKPEVAALILDGYGHAKVVTANNVFAHLDNIHPFILSVRMLMNQDSWFIFENAYWYKTFNNNDLGQIYHEHTSYHSIKPLQKLFRSYGMNIVHVEENDIQCGTIRVFVKLAQNGEYIDYNAVTSRIQKEEECGLFKVETYQNMMVRANENGQKLKELLIKLKESKQKICLYGWPAKFSTLGAFWDIYQYIDFVIDDAVVKQNMFSPIGNIKIYNSTKLNESDYCLIGAYNFNKSIMKNNSDYNGKWITILPQVKINI